MADRKTHCDDCIRYLGEPHDRVHAWLDAYVAAYRGQVRHRLKRHHSEGVEQVRRMWGDQAARAAKIHIMRDFGLLDNPNAAESDIPNDAKEASILLAIWLQEQGLV